MSARASTPYSIRSGGGANECVEVAIGADRVRVRDSTNPDAGQLELTPAAWAVFIEGVKFGTFDRS